MTKGLYYRVRIKAAGKPDVPIRSQYAEVFRSAIRRNATNIIVAHNHPSGDPNPSPEDVAITRRLVSAGKNVEISVLDHIVIGKGRSISLRERNLGFEEAEEEHAR